MSNIQVSSVFPIFVISLPDAQDRRSFMQRQLDALHLPFEFIDAFYGTHYVLNPQYYDEKKTLRYEKKKLTSGEIGCALSHSFAYKLIAKRSLAYALILEDDAVLSADLPAVLERIVPFLNDSMIITLERCDVYKKRSLKSVYNDYFLAEPLFIKEGAIAQSAAYIVTASAAKKIQNINFPVYFPADNWWYYTSQVSFFGLIPSQTLVKQSSQFYSSTLQSPSKRNFKKNSIFTYILHGFFTYNFFGHLIYKILHPIYKKIRG